MSRLTLKQKKEWAQQLYTRDNFTQKEIAERVGISAPTMSKWVREGKWDELKVSITLTKEEQLKNMYRQIGELNDAILDREKGARFATPSEADTIGKLASAIEKMETEIGLKDIVEAFRLLLNWLRTFDIDEAQRITPLLDAFVKDRMK